MYSSTQYIQVTYILYKCTNSQYCIYNLPISCPNHLYFIYLCIHQLCSLILFCIHHKRFVHISIPPFILLTVQRKMYLSINLLMYLSIIPSNHLQLYGDTLTLAHTNTHPLPHTHTHTYKKKTIQRYTHTIVFILFFEFESNDYHDQSLNSNSMYIYYFPVLKIENQYLQLNCPSEGMRTALGIEISF